VGCAVAYRREYLKEFFDHYEPAMGDDMTSSEDIFIGMALAAQGYHNTQLLEVHSRTAVPEVHKLHKQLLKWSSSWFQTAYHLPDMLTSPFRVLRRYRHNRRNAEVAQKRRVVDGYRQPFGLRFSKSLGRPTGWIMFMGLFEKIAFLLVMLILIAIGAWESLALTVIAETVLFTTLLVYVSKGRRVEYAVKGLSAMPFRYGMMLTDIAVLGRFIADLITGHRGWRK